MGGWVGQGKGARRAGGGDGVGADMLSEGNTVVFWDHKWGEGGGGWGPRARGEGGGGEGEGRQVFWAKVALCAITGVG